jgi:hypothetical protein
VSPAPGADGPAINSSASWVAALRWGMETAMAQGARRITWVDTSFASWPLDDLAQLGPLIPWLRLPLRRLVLLAAGYGGVPREHPRFNTWRRPWVHAIDAWQAPPELAAELPSLLLGDDGTVVQLFDAEHWRGRAQVNARTAYNLQQQIDVVLQRAEPAFPVNTLGL